MTNNHNCTMRVLGIDPGSRVTGFGVVEFNNPQQPKYIICGCIRTKHNNLPQRLLEIHHGIQELINIYQPRQMAIEQVFVAHNVASALKLGQARAAAILASMQQNIMVYEYAPTQIKQAIVGVGHAQKQQVQQMVKLLLSLPTAPATDAADALAVALCHINNYYSRAK
jgi:crossover junction endodeoxyribonuclease RuvC